jgi:uncharacterized protein YpmS
MSLKKSTDKVDARQSIAWRPNFSDPSKLPDVKVVRTTFFVNSAAILILAAVFYFVGSREYSLFQLRNDIEAIESQIATTKPESDKAIATYNKYKTEEKKLTDVLSITAESLVFSDYVMHLGEILPDNITMQRIVHRGAGQMLSLTMTVQGIDADAAELITQYIKKLQDDKLSKELFTAITYDVIRNAALKNQTVEISMIVKPYKK